MAPVSAMACVSANVSTLGTPCRRAEAIFLVHKVFDVITVLSSLLVTVVYWGPEHKSRYHCYIYDYLPAPPHTIRRSEAASCALPWCKHRTLHRCIAKHYFDCMPLDGLHAAMLGDM